MMYKIYNVNIKKKTVFTKCYSQNICNEISPNNKNQKTEIMTIIVHTAIILPK